MQSIVALPSSPPSVIGLQVPSNSSLHLPSGDSRNVSSQSHTPLALGVTDDLFREVMRAKTSVVKRILSIETLFGGYRVTPESDIVMQNIRYIGRDGIFDYDKVMEVGSKPGPDGWQTLGANEAVRQLRKKDKDEEIAYDIEGFITPMEVIRRIRVGGYTGYIGSIILQYYKPRDREEALYYVVGLGITEYTEQYIDPKGGELQSA